MPSDHWSRTTEILSDIAADIEMLQPGEQAGRLYRLAFRAGAVLAEHDRLDLVDEARTTLFSAAIAMTHDPKRGRWTAQELSRQINNGLKDGLAKRRDVFFNENVSRSHNGSGHYNGRSHTAAEDRNDAATDPAVDQWPELPHKRGEIRRHIYRKNRRPVLIKVRFPDDHPGGKYRPFYLVRNSSAGLWEWQDTKPADFDPIPYNADLLADP
jgi:hypothetical protein